MALQRYAVFIDFTHDQDRVLRYEACGEANLAAVYQRLHPEEAAIRPEEVQRLSVLNPLAPEYWAVVDADKLDARTEELAHPDRPGDPVGEVPTQALRFLAVGFTRIDRFILFANVPLARAWLRRARDLIWAARTGQPTYDPGQSPDAEYERRWATSDGPASAATGAWGALGCYFRALGLHPWGWARYRLALEQTLVTGAGVTINFQGIRATRPKARPAWTSLRPLGRQAFLVAPPTEAEYAVGPWRAFFSRWFENQAQTVPGFANAAAAEGVTSPFVATLSNVMFGTPADVARNQHDLRNTSDCLVTDPDGSECLGPNGSVLSVWLTNAGDARGGGYAYQCPGTDRLNCPTMTVQGGVVYGTNAVNWQLDMLEELVAYCEGRSEFAMIAEVRLDVTGKNMWTAQSLGTSEILGGNPALFVQAQDIAAADRTRATVDRVITLVGGITTGVLTAALGPAGTLIGGGVTAVAGFAGRVILSFGGDAPAYDADVFGRVEPVMESFGFTSVSRGSERATAMALQPSWPPWYGSGEDGAIYGWESTAPTAAITRYVPSPIEPLATPRQVGKVGSALSGASAGSKAAALAGVMTLAAVISYALARSSRRAAPPRAPAAPVRAPRAA